mmetsp:Transcript_7901/g.31235  ORF Transcript_7901/g.31235 Transcript_7901/m.31235 type:complete len:283 (-) Transcript_7901:59-907(-)
MLGRSHPRRCAGSAQRRQGSGHKRGHELARCLAHRRRACQNQLARLRTEPPRKLGKLGLVVACGSRGFRRQAQRLLDVNAVHVQPPRGGEQRACCRRQSSPRAFFSVLPASAATRRSGSGSVSRHAAGPEHSRTVAEPRGRASAQPQELKHAVGKGLVAVGDGALDLARDGRDEGRRGLQRGRAPGAFAVLDDGLGKSHARSPKPRVKVVPDDGHQRQGLQPAEQGRRQTRILHEQKRGDFPQQHCLRVRVHAGLEHPNVSLQHFRRHGAPGLRTPCRRVAT